MAAMAAIFAGRSLADELPEAAGEPRSPDCAGELVIGSERIARPRESPDLPAGGEIPARSWHGTQQFRPLPEFPPDSSVARVRAEAARLGIDYDAEVARTLNRMQNPRWQNAPGPGDSRAGANPVSKATPYDRELAQVLVKDQLRMFHGITWK